MDTRRPSPPEPPAPPPGPSPARRIVALSLLAALGISLAEIPHLEAWGRIGEPTYLADGDDLLYLAWSRDVVLSGGGSLVDAVHPRSGPLMHPWALFVPQGLLAYGLGAGMTGVGLVWRALVGILMPLSFYFAIRGAVRNFWVALAFAAILTCDSGTLFGDLWRHDLVILAKLLRDPAALGLGGAELAHFRVVTPAMAIPFLFVFYGCLLRARHRPERRWAYAAAVAFGTLFYVYFYFWTAVLVGLGLAFLLDGRDRGRVALIGALGLAIGLPAVWYNYRLKATTPADWLHRTEKFLRVADPSAHVQLPGFVIALLVAYLPYVLWRRRDLLPIWCCAVAGLICLNHTVVTGQLVENFHWFQSAGLATSLLTALVASSLLFGRAIAAGGDEPVPRGRRWLVAALYALVAVQIPLGGYLRWFESARTDEARALSALYVRVKDGMPRLPSGAIVAGDPLTLFLVAALDDVFPLWSRLVEYSSASTDAELDRRLVLNFYLTGVTRDEARRQIEGPTRLSRESHASVDPRVDSRIRTDRLALLETIYADPGPSIDLFKVGYVLLPHGSSPGHLADRARLHSEGRYWDLYSVADPADATSAERRERAAQPSSEGPRPDPPGPTDCATRR